MYGLQHTLILRRNYDSDAIIKTVVKENGVDKVADRKVNISKFSWYMPHVTLNDEAKLSLMKDIKKVFNRHRIVTIIDWVKCLKVVC